MEGAESMHKRVINVLLSAFTIAFLSFSSCTNAFAAEASNKTDIPKSIIICIMLAVFIITAVIAGFVSFKIKKNSISRSEKNSSEETKDQ